MPTKYRFVTNGDFREFYDDASLVVTVHKDSMAVTWQYDSSPGIVFTIAEFGYHTDDVGDISFDDVPLTTQAGFKTSVQAMFPGYAGSNSETPGIDDVLAEEQQLSANRNIDLNGNDLTINGPEGFRFSSNSLSVYKLNVTRADGGQIQIYSPNGSPFNITVNDSGEIVVIPD